MMNKEEIYDAEISPLMQQVIALCQKRGIAMVASFAIDHDGEGPDGEDCTRLTCNTLLPDGAGVHDPRFVAANRHIRGVASYVGAITITDNQPAPGQGEDA